ncbi:MAG: protease pro-enzyme activation domain-containing protein, partial [Thermoplasmata archaeon]
MAQSASERSQRNGTRSGWWTMRQGGGPRFERIGVAILVAVLMASPIGFMGIAAAHGAPVSAAPSEPATAPVWSIEALQQAPLRPVLDTEPGVSLPGAIDLGPATTTSLHVLVGFAWSNASQLSSYLATLSLPTSPLYHHYLSHAQFDAEYGGSPTVYAESVAYFGSFGVSNLTTFADRGTLAFDTTPAIAEEIFHTILREYEVDGIRYDGPSSATLQLPSPIAGSVVAVDGLSSYSEYVTHTDMLPTSPLHAPPPSSSTPSTYPGGGYYTPAEVQGVQYEYGPDLQVAYDELSLFQQDGYATGQVVATILWAGAASGGASVAPWDPADIYAYYNETLPTGQPHAQVFGVPLGGAPGPGTSAGSDVSGAVSENTLDLEMIGSTAPGAQIYNVYGPNPAEAFTDEALVTILNAPADTPLHSVTAISNSWTSTDYNNTVWYDGLQEAQAVGVTVLASSGDSGGNPHSSRWEGTNVGFPATTAYNTFGVTSVGGTTSTLSAQSLHLTSQTVWYEASNSPDGSSGGISTVVAEPSWQLSSLASRLIGGTGLGVPDVAAIANNTLITITIGTMQYKATNATNGGVFYDEAGTSVACPLIAGIIAEINHTLAASGERPLGYLNPDLYRLADLQFAPPPDTPTTGVVQTGTYNSSLPTLPLLDVIQGHNFNESARYGYDLVTGWGPIDAYNYTMYMLSAHSAGVYGRLSAVQDDLALNALKVTSIGHSAQYNASIQQNFFLADSLGAPVYWVQNVIYILGTPGDWEMTYSGWVIYPFFGLYPALSVYEYNFPAEHVVNLPATFDVISRLLTAPGFNAENVTFSVGGSTLELPVPGAAYIIGSQYYNYSWQGTTYSNGPFPDNPTPGGLAPQFGLVGGPSGGSGEFQAPTAGSLTTSVAPYGSATFVADVSRTFGESIDQTGEVAWNLAWTYAAGTWSLGTEPGSTTQGVLSYENVTASSYDVTLAESGLPVGTTWFANSTDSAWAGRSATVTPSGGTTITIPLTNGSYSARLAASDPRYAAHPAVITFSVDGAALAVPVAFEPYNRAATFRETGLPTGTPWTVDVGGVGSLSTAGNSLQFSLINGSYAYTLSDSNPTWGPSRPNGTFAVAGHNLTVPVSFEFVYSVDVTESGLPPGTLWFVNVSGGSPVHALGSVPAGPPVALSVTHSSTNASILFSLPNGSYSYTVASADPSWRPESASNSLSIAGAPVSESAPFVKTYPVTFHENGLPSESEWFVNVSGGGSTSSTTPALLIQLPNGTYSYRVQSVDKNVATTENGTLTVDGAALSIIVYFAGYTLDVPFEETGLPSGATWYVNVTGALPESGTGPEIRVPLVNGTYAYAVASADKRWAPEPAHGSFTVHGTPTTRVLHFAEVAYVLGFTQSGLPSAATWHVLVGGAGSNSSAGSELTFSLPNGTYEFQVRVSPTTYEADPASGNVTIDGAGTAVAVRIVPVLYAVIASNSGLPTGSLWFLNLTGG